MVSIFEPSTSNPYKINKSEPTIFRVACSAGVNRSATLREYLKSNLSDFHMFYPPYGAHLGDYNNPTITCIRTLKPDGFTELFGCAKTPSIQAVLFDKLFYPHMNDFESQKLNDMDKATYKELIIDYFWTIESEKKNIFIIINDDEDTIHNVLTELLKLDRPIDLVILRISDTIYYPINNEIKSQSKEAYQHFIGTASQFFEFY